MRFFDSHAHLNQGEFDADRVEMIARAHAAGVEEIVTVGYNVASSIENIAIAEAHPGLFAAVGIQPNDAANAAPADWQRIVELVRSPRVVAIGETGLDGYWKTSPLDVQQDYFDRHLRLSQQISLPFIVHTRDSDSEVLAMLREAHARGPLSGVMHSFTGSEQAAAECVALGLYISFAGMVTFKKSEALRAVVATIPADRILIETDAPYLSPHPLRGKRNEPAHLVHTAECLAAVRGVGVEEFARQTTANAERLFRLPTAQ
jgi:TatD DNase family protein